MMKTVAADKSTYICELFISIYTIIVFADVLCAYVVHAINAQTKGAIIF